MANSSRTQRIRSITIAILLFLGVVSIIVALAADDLGLDITPGFGVVQMVALLFGLTLLTGATFLFLYSRRPKGAPRSLQAEIATRLSATGLILCYITGLSDLIGIGTHIDPAFERPFIGPLQLGGILLGVCLIIAGLLLYHTSRGQRESSSLGFLVSDKQNGDAP